MNSRRRFGGRPIGPKIGHPLRARCNERRNVPRGCGRGSQDSGAPTASAAARPAIRIVLIIVSRVPRAIGS
jgi:hypothetical protein